MKNISKLAIILGLLLQVAGHPIKSDWDLVAIPFEDHPPPLRTEYKFMWPVPAIFIASVEGCTTSIHVESNILAWAVLYDIIFWLVVFYILERWCYL